MDEKDLGVLVTNEFDWEKQIIRNYSTATFAAKRSSNLFILNLLKILNFYKNNYSSEVGVCQCDMESCQKEIYRYVRKGAETFYQIRTVCEVRL